jgi:hypothetical protein
MQFDPNERWSAVLRGGTCHGRGRGSAQPKLSGIQTLPAARGWRSDAAKALRDGENGQHRARPLRV